MSENNGQNNEQNNIVKKAGDTLKKGAKNAGKEAVKKVIKKILAVLAPILLKLFIIIIIAIVILQLISWLVQWLKSDEAKESQESAIVYEYTEIGDGDVILLEGDDEASEEETGKKITGYQISVKPDVEKKAYILKYRFFDSNGDELTEKEVLENIKEELEDKELDSRVFTDSELKIIATLGQKGLSIGSFTEEELKCFALFVKAEIAGQNFDLRNGSEIGKETDIEDIRKNDYVYGILQASKTTTGESGYSTQALTYKEYGDDEKEDSFMNLVATDNIEAGNYFTIDNKGNLICATWSKTNTDISYLDEGGRELSEDEQSNIPDQNKRENKSKITVITTSPINYKAYILKYSLKYGVLSDLLITTENTDFCMELTALAFNSKIIIGLNEETSTTVVNTTYKYTETKMECKNISYQTNGAKIIPEDVDRDTKNSGQASSVQDIVISGDNFGWGPSVYNAAPYAETAERVFYRWKYNNNDYEIVYIKIGEYAGSWVLSELDITPPYPDPYPEDKGTELIVKGHDDKFGDYTKCDTWTYVVKSTVTGTSHTYSFDVVKIDTWFAKYEKENNANIEVEDTPGGSDSSTEGEYKKTSTGTITSEATIENDGDAQALKARKEQEYKNKYTDAENVECKITKIATELWGKEDKDTSRRSNRTKYSFGKNEADTTEISYKNIKIIDNVATYTEEDDEEGFLYLFNKYTQRGDMFLEEDAETKLFTLLESNKDTYIQSIVIKYLLYVYNGKIDELNDLNLSLFNVRPIIIKGNSIKMITNTTISLEEFVDKVQNFSYAVQKGSSTQVFRDNAELIYDICVSNGINPVLCAAQGWKEQHWDDPGTSPYNFWGIAVYNHQDYGTSYPSMAAAVQGYCDQINSQLNGNLRSHYQKHAQEYATVNSKFRGDMTTIYDVFSCYSVTDDDDLQVRADGAAAYVDSVIECAKLIFGDDIFKFSTQLNWNGESYESREYIFPVYNQYDPRWVDHLYGIFYPDKTIGTSGCGCCAMAAILSGYLGEAITPDVLTDILDDIYPDGRYYSYDNGSTRYIHSDKVLNYFNCSGKEPMERDAIEALQNGYCVLGGETGHYLAFVPVSDEDYALGYMFRIIDSALGHNYLCRDFAEASEYVNGHAIVQYIIYPPGY